jgi:hypothetical protein
MNKTFLFLSLLISLPAFSTNIEQNPFVSEHESVAQTANGVFVGLGACGLFAFGFFNQANKASAQRIFETQKSYRAFKARMESGEFDHRTDLPDYDYSAKGGKNNFTSAQWEKLKAAHKARRYENFREGIRNGMFDDEWRMPPWEFESGFTHEQRENLRNERQARHNRRRYERPDDEYERNRREREDEARREKREREEDHYEDLFGRKPDPEQEKLRHQAEMAQREIDRLEAQAHAEKAKGDAINRNAFNKKEYDALRARMERGDFDDQAKLPEQQMADFNQQQQACLGSLFQARKAKLQAEAQLAEAQKELDKAQHDREKKRHEEEVRREEAKAKAEAEVKRMLERMAYQSEEGRQKIADAWRQFPGVPRTATKAELSAAFKRLSKNVHPSRFAGQDESVIAEKTEQFKALQNAYDILQLFVD